MESDPNGKDRHDPGAKLDAGKMRPSLILRDMSRAVAAVAEVGTFGANKYSDGGWLHVPDAGQRYTDAMLRHYLSESRGEVRDRDSGLRHAAHLAWNALARLELMLRTDIEQDEPELTPRSVIRSALDHIGEDSVYAMGSITIPPGETYEFPGTFSIREFVAPPVRECLNNWMPDLQVERGCGLCSHATDCRPPKRANEE